MQKHTSYVLRACNGLYAPQGVELDKRHEWSLMTWGVNVHGWQALYNLGVGIGLVGFSINILADVACLGAMKVLQQY